MAQKTTHKNAVRKTNKPAKGRSTASPRKKALRKGRKKTRQIHLSIWAVTAVILATGLFIAWPYLRNRPSSEEKGACVPKGTYVYGIDISHFQPDVEWDSLMVLTDGARRTMKSMTHAKDIRPVSYVFIKATEGNTMKDKCFRKHWKEAGESGLRRGAYHFFRSSKDPVQQAKNFIKTVGTIRYKDLPPVLDIETIHAGCSHKTLNEKALKWLKTVEEYYGRKPIIYSSAAFIDDILCDEIKNNYPVWVAHYGADKPRCDRWHIWQFTDKAVVHGIDGFVDLNVCPSGIIEKL